MGDEILGDRGKALEELFFARQSENLRKALQKKEEMNNKKEVLSEASGITDDAVLEQLVALGRARTVAESAGGFLGIGAISPEEEDKLEELARVFS